MASQVVETGTEVDLPLRTLQAAEGIRGMIVGRKLAPGRQLRQEELARELGMSKSPVREALKVLQGEGLLRYSPNQGYFVPVLDAGEMKQIYTMRESMEAIVNRAIPPVSKSYLSDLRKLNNSMKKAVPALDFGRLNRDFHFAIFAASKLDLIIRELDRLWSMSDAYRAIYLNMTYNASTERITSEHDLMIDAISRRDLEALAQLSDAHRHVGENFVLSLLSAS
jgi:DNA-binding GntR family transcriptional regulator